MQAKNLKAVVGEDTNHGDKKLEVKRCNRI